MRIFLALLVLVPLTAPAADITQQSIITCVSDESSLQGRHKEYVARKNSEKAKSFFSQMLLAENFGNMKSKIRFVWRPRTDKGPKIDIETTDKPHNLLKIRSKTRNSLIVVSSASSPFSVESWTFVFNFEVETVIATRVQSNIGSLKGEVITYNCRFDALDAEPETTDNPTS